MPYPWTFPLRGILRVGPDCEEEPNRRARMWRARFTPRRRSTDGAYVGVSTDRSARVELALESGRRPIPVFGLAAPEARWGYGGSGSQEGATSILADYLGFLPRPQLRARFEREVVSNLPAGQSRSPSQSSTRGSSMQIEQCAAGWS